MDSFSQMTQEQKQVRQQLSTRQNWKSKKFSSEQLRQHHMKKVLKHHNEYNEKFAKKVQENVPAASASQTAVGITAQTEPAAKESYKEKKERQKKEKAAKKAHPDANHISYDIKDNLQHYKSYYNNSLSAMPADIESQCQRNQVDKRILKAFTKGHRVNKKGEPEDEIDLQEKQQDIAFYADYSSCELNRRIPHLQRIVKEVLDSPLSPDLFTTPMMQEYAGMIQNQIERMTVLISVLDDPINKPFFKQLSQVELGSLYIQARASVYYEKTFQEFLGAHVIDYKTGKYLSYNHRNDVNPEASDFSTDLKTLKKEIGNCIKEKYEIRKDAAADSLMKDANKRKELYHENSLERANLGLTSYVNEYIVDSLAACRTLIEKHPEAYEKNKKLINKIYEDVYRTVDLMGDYVLRSQSATIAVNHFSSKLSNQLTYEERETLTYSEADNDAVSEEIEILQKRILTCTDSLGYLVGEKALSRAASYYLEKMR